LFAEATIANLANCLRAESVREVDAEVMPIQPEGSLPPLFFLHGDFGGGLYCRRIGRLIGQDQPLYGVMPNGYDGKPFLPSVEAMAAENIKHVTAVYSRGPYLLGGYCNGGIVAYEMARQMTQQGLEVGAVIMLDTWVPRHFGWLKAVVHVAGALAGVNLETRARRYSQLRNYLVQTQRTYRRDFGGVWHLFFQKASEALARFRGTLPNRQGPEAALFDDPLYYRRYPEFGQILSEYRPKPYAGRVILLRSHYLDGSYPQDRTAGWGKFASQMEVRSLPGDHLTILTEHIGAVAEHLERYLRALRSGHASPKRSS
jgi:thioesterase domain-containing protein